jgi:hypothetical protein
MNSLYDKNTSGKHTRILRSTSLQTPASLVFSEEMFYGCFVSSFSHYQPAYASSRIFLCSKGMPWRCVATGKGSWSWINGLVNIFAEHAHTERRYAQSACGAVLEEASGDIVPTYLPSRLSRVRVPSPAFSFRPSPSWRLGSQSMASKQ